MPELGDGGEQPDCREHAADTPFDDFSISLGSEQKKLAAAQHPLLSLRQSAAKSLAMDFATERMSSASS